MERITEQAPRPATGDPARAARAAGNAFIMFWAVAVLTSVGGLLALEPLLTVFGTTEELRGMARDYAVIILAGAIFATGFSSLVRAEGRMRFSTLLWVVPVLVQITLDPLLIFGFGMGVRGAALGTVGGQAVSAGMALWFFFGRRRRPYRITPADLKPHWPTIAELIGVGHRPSWPASAPPCASCWSTLACPGTPAPSPWPRGRSAPGSRPSSRCRSSASAKACSRSSASMPAADCVRGCCGPAICL